MNPNLIGNMIKKLLPYIFRLGIEKLFIPNRTLNIFYHGVAPTYDPDFKTVSVQDFDRQMEYFKKNFDIIPLSPACEMKLSKFKTKRRTLTISFDDGFLNNLVCAYPILEKYQIPATVFVCGISTTDNPDLYIGQFRDRLKCTQENEIYWNLLNRDKLKELSEKPLIEIGSHCNYHIRLTEIVNYDQLRDELRVSKKNIEDLIQKPVTSLAFPFGAYNDCIVAHAKIAGYKNLLSVDKPDKYSGVLPRWGVSGKSTFEANMLNIIKAFYRYGY